MKEMLVKGENMNTILRILKVSQTNLPVIHMNMNLMIQDTQNLQTILKGTLTIIQEWTIIHIDMMIIIIIMNLKVIMMK